jgi:hypothetical protein
VSKAKRWDDAGALAVNHVLGMARTIKVPTAQKYHYPPLFIAIGR